MFQLKVLFYKAMAKALKLATKLLPMRQPMMFVGEDSSLQLARSIAYQDRKKVFVVTDEILSQLGVLEPFLAELKLQQVDYVLYDKVQPDPTAELITHATEQLKTSDCDAVVGFGGGSSMDAAKVIAVLPGLNKSVNQIEGVLKVRKRTLPLYLIPTTAGTGSEVTIAAVVSSKQLKKKIPIADPVLLPDAAVLDPKLMLGMPPGVTAATGMDALTHAVEAYLSKNADDNTDGYAKAAIKLIFANLQTSFEQGTDIKAREAMAIASNYAGIAFTTAGLGYVHGIAHKLGALYGIPHGKANAIVLPYILRLYQPHATQKLAELAQLLDLGGIDDTPAQQAEAFIQALLKLREQVAIPDKIAELEPQHISVIAQSALEESHRLYAVPYYMDQQECEALIKTMG